MTVPTSIKLALDKVEKNLKLMRRNKQSIDETRVDAGEIVTSLVLTLDKLMNLVFQNFAKDEGKKPHVYFPMSGSKDRLDERLKKYKLDAISESTPGLYAAICSIQPFASGSPTWWKNLFEIAQKRHEDHPLINTVTRNGIAIGRPGYDVHIGHLIADGRTNTVMVKGHEVDQKTGKASKIKLTRHSSTIEMLENTGIDPATFLSICLAETRALAKLICDNFT